MTIDDYIKDEKTQYDINREGAKIPALSSGKINNYEFLAGKKLLPFNQKQVTEQAKFTYFSLGKAFEKQTKTIEDHGKNIVKSDALAKKYDDAKNDSESVLKQKLVDKRKDEIIEVVVYRVFWRDRGRAILNFQPLKTA